MSIKVPYAYSSELVITTKKEKEIIGLNQCKLKLKEKLSFVNNYDMIIKIAMCHLDISNKDLFDRIKYLKEKINKDEELNLNLDSLKCMMLFLVCERFIKPTITFINYFQCNWKINNTIITISFKENFTVNFVIIKNIEDTKNLETINGKMSLLSFIKLLIDTGYYNFIFLN